MAVGPLPDDIQNFIIRYIDSVAQLEALLLFRANPERRWSVAELAARLYIAEADGVKLLDRLCGDRFLSVDQELFRFDCADNALEEQVHRLGALYATHLIPITNMIHAKPRRIREFADAFKFKKGR